MKHLILLLGLLLPGSKMIFAQSLGPAVINAAGGQATISGNTYEFALGGAFSGNTVERPNLVVTPGVLQPQIDEPTTLPSLKIDAGQMAVYPNPAEKLVFLKPSFGAAGHLSAQLTDALGRRMLQQDLELTTGNETQQLDLAALAAGSYYLGVRWQSQGKVYEAAYKIQKIR